jgi:hypothetical protein
MLHGAAGSWIWRATPGRVNVTSISGTGVADVYAGAVSGVLFHFDGVAWLRVDLAASLPYSICMTTWDVASGVDGVLIAATGKKAICPQGVFRVDDGEAALVGNWRGPTWSVVAIDTQLFAAAGSAIRRLDGEEWTPLLTDEGRGFPGKLRGPDIPLVG